MVEMKRGVTVDLTCAGLAFFLPEEEVGGQNGSANGGEFVTKNSREHFGSSLWWMSACSQGNLYSC
jgi:hypothetical protein